jgi:hypothetical protein
MMPLLPSLIFYFRIHARAEHTASGAPGISPNPKSVDRSCVERSPLTIRDWKIHLQKFIMQCNLAVRTLFTTCLVSTFHYFADAKFPARKRCRPRVSIVTTRSTCVHATWLGALTLLLAAVDFELVLSQEKKRIGPVLTVLPSFLRRTPLENWRCSLK